MKLYTLTLMTLLAAFLLASCNLFRSGPPDDFLRSDFSNEVTNLQIKRKIKCDSISPEAQALGIDEAWLVAFEYDSPDKSVGHISNYIQLYVFAEGEWQPTYMALFSYGLDLQTCP